MATGERKVGWSRQELPRTRPVKVYLISAEPMRAAFPYPHCLTAGFPANHALKYNTANDTFIKEYPIGPANFYEDDERHRIHNAVPSNRLGHLTPFRTHYVDLNTGP